MAAKKKIDTRTRMRYWINEDYRDALDRAAALTGCTRTRLLEIATERLLESMRIEHPKKYADVKLMGEK